MIQPLRSATVFSLAADPPRALLAQSEAHAEFDAAMLVDVAARHPCSLQRLSAAGATLRIDLETEMPEGAPMTLELANGQAIDGTIAWRQGGEAGFVFEAPIDVISTLARNLASLPADRRAMPRVEIHQSASIRRGAKVQLARTRNISQGGIGIETSLDLTVGETVQITVDGLRPLDGSVRWVGGGQAGIAFAAELGWQVLMPWLRNAQQMPARAAPLPFGEPEGLIPDKHAIRLDAPAQVRSGVHWWNAQVRALTSQLVELETRAAVLPGAQLWVSLPEIGGGPASVIEVGRGRILCEFRLPLRPRELGLLTGTRPIS